MNHRHYILIISALIVALILPGCKAAYDQPQSTEQIQNAQPTQTDSPSPTLVNPSKDFEPSWSDIPELGLQSGKLRIRYTGINGGVQYVSSVSDLPDYECFAGYDEEFFRENALVIVTETVGSGSLDVGIKSISIEEGIATITLYHKMEGDVGTDDMATWLLWAEVDAGLELTWTVANPAYRPNNSKY